MSAAPPALPEPGSLLGRDAELAALREHAGAGLTALRAVLVSGTPGAGKSAVCRRVLSELPDGYPEVLDVACAPGHTEPLQTLRLACRSLAGHPHVEGVFARWPEVCGLFATRATDPPSGLAAARLAAGVRELCTRCGPVVLAVDDVHLADLATLDVLGRLLVTGGEAPLLVLMSGRTDGGRLRAERARWRRCTGFAELALAPLPDDAVAELLRQARLPARASAVEQAAGNPLLALRLAGAVAPAVIDDLVAEALDPLDAVARRILQVACVADGDLTVDALAGVVGVVEDVEPGLRAVLERELVTLDAATERVRMVDPIVRHGVLSVMTGEERRRWHRACAPLTGDALAAVEHWLAGGAPERALQVAATGARDLLADDPGAALATARRAVELAATLDMDPLRTAGLWVPLARAADAVGRHGETIAAWHRARELAEVPGGDPARSVELLCTVAEGLADGADLGGALAAARSAMAHATDAPCAAATLGWVLALRHDPAVLDAVPAVPAVAATAGAGASPEQLLVALATAAARFDRGEATLGTTMIAAVADAATRADLPALACRAHALHAACLRRRGDRDAAAATAVRGMRMAGYARLPAAGRRLRILAELAGWEDDNLPPTSPDPGPEERYLAAVRTARYGSVADALAAVERVLGDCPPDLRDEAELWLAWLLLAADRRERAAAVLRRWSARQGYWWREAYVPVACALIVRAAGVNRAVEARCTQALDRLAEVLGEVPDLAAAGAALLRGELAAEPREWMRAADLFAAAGEPFLAAQVQLWAAEAALAAGRRGLGGERLGAALDAARAHGFASLVDQAHGVARRHHMTLGVGLLPPLTAEEHELLTLLAEGCDNAEIAARLFISVRTASARVSRLLRTLGVAHRAQAAALALEQNEEAR